MNRDVKVAVVGCDDTTYVVIKDATVREQEFLQFLSKAVTDASEYGCMPRIYTDLTDDNEYGINMRYDEYNDYKVVERDA